MIAFDYRMSFMKKVVYYRGFISIKAFLHFRFWRGDFFVLLAHEWHEVLRHEVRFLRGTIISLHVFQKTQENGRNSHWIDIEKTNGNDVSPNSNDQSWQPNSINSWGVDAYFLQPALLDLIWLVAIQIFHFYLDLTAEKCPSQCTTAKCDHHFTQKEHKTCSSVQGSSSCSIWNNQFYCLK